MKFALVNIPDIGFSGKGYTTPLGLAYIGAVVRNLGLEVKAYDLGVSKSSLRKYYLKTDRNFIKSIIEFNPDFIGISCTTTNRFNVKFWCREFKKVLPDTNIIIGGPHPFFIPELYLDCNPFVDVLVLGEGENTIAEYLDAIRNGKNIKNVKGLAFKDHNGKVILTPKQDAIKNLDEISFPARDLFPMKEYDLKFGTISGNTATLITSRGCGNTCKFCCTTQYWRVVRFRSAKNVVDEIEYVLKEFPFIKNFVFFDDTFTSNRKHAISVCKEILKRKIKINWACWSRTNIVDSEYFKILKESGCTTLSYGIESGNDLMLKTIRKHSTVKKNYLALIEGRKQGLITRGTMICGMPEEKLVWAIDSIFFKANSGIGPGDLRMSLMTFMYPGTYWEKWFREKYTDFSWKKIPKRFRAGSFNDEFGNVLLPCYKWRGIPFNIVKLLCALYSSPRFRKLLRFKYFQAIVRAIVRLYPLSYPKSLYDPYTFLDLIGSKLISKISKIIKRIVSPIRQIWHDF